VDGFVVERRRALLAHQHREADVIRVAPDERAYAIGVGELTRVRFEVERDGGAALGARDGLHRELAIRARFPANARIFGRAGLARLDRDAICDDKGRIEADAELADELRILLLVPGELAEELRRAGLRD